MPSKATYKFIEFVRPHCLWPHPYSTEQAFGVMAWMIDTADPERDINSTKWGDQTVESLLSKKPTCTSMYTIEPVVSLKDLRERFHYAILDHSFGGIQAWRERNRITPNGSRAIAFPHAVPCQDDESENAIIQAFDRLFSWSGRLNVQLNECHNRAREIYGVQMTYRRRLPGWRFELSYGFDGSVWHRTVARQRPKERLLPALRRAIAYMQEITFKHPS